MDNIILVGKGYQNSQKGMNINTQRLEINSNKKINKSFKKNLDSNRVWNCIPNFSKPDIVYPKIEKTEFSPQIQKIKKKEKVNSSFELRGSMANNMHYKYKLIECNNSNHSEITKTSSNAVSFKKRIKQLKLLTKITKKSNPEYEYDFAKDRTKEIHSRREEKKMLDNPEKLITKILQLDSFNRNFR